MRGLLAPVWMGAVLASGTAQAACDRETLRGHLDAGLHAWQHADAAGLAAAQQGAREQLDCLTEVLAPEEAARTHELEALYWFERREMSRVEDALVAARAADGREELDKGIAEAGHPLHLTFERGKRREPDGGVEMALPQGITGWVDGTQTTERPLERPYFLQLVGEDGAILTNRYLLAEERVSVPALLGIEPPRVESAPSTMAPMPVAPQRKITGGQVALVAVGAALTAGSGALLGVALSERASYLDAETPEEDLDGHHNTANALGYAAQGSLAAGLVCVGLAFAVPF